MVVPTFGNLLLIMKPSFLLNNPAVRDRA